MGPGDPATFIPLDPLSIDGNTGEKPQSKVWEYADDWWSVLPNGSGTWVWRLDGTTWNPVVQVSDNSDVHADVKAIDNLAHILLYDGRTSQLASIEYTPGNPAIFVKQAQQKMLCTNISVLQAFRFFSSEA